MSVDLRTRHDPELELVGPSEFFESTLPQALSRHADTIRPGAAHLRLRPLTIEVEGDTWTLLRVDDEIRIRHGRRDAAHLRLSAAMLQELVTDQATPMTIHATGKLDMPAGALADCFDWWVVMRSALDGTPVHVPGSIRFSAIDGSPLEIDRSFHAEDDPVEMRHFLEETGFLHVRSALRGECLEAISADIDLAASRYFEGDGRSWWVTLRSGERRLARMQDFLAESPSMAEVLYHPALVKLTELTGDGHLYELTDPNTAQALMKPPDVVTGLSDVPWHKDCSLGRHSYECCGLTLGICITCADAHHGQLAVVPGSHRALIWPALALPTDLPVHKITAEPGDVSVHLSCTMHCSIPPRKDGRRVVYVNCPLPPRG